MTLTKPYEATFQVGDGETKDFPFYFDEVSENFIRVIIKRADGSIYYPTFSVDMELLRVVFGEDEITPTPDDIICIYRDTPAIQDTQFNTLQGYNAKALENILSKIVAMIQEMKANGFSTQILQGEPWSLDLIKPADDGASVQIDYETRLLKKGLYFKMVDGNLQASANGVDFVQMPKSAEVKEFRHRVDTDGNIHFEYRVDKDWIGLRGTTETYDRQYIDSQIVKINAGIDANADAIQKTRDDYMADDAEIHKILNTHASELTTLRGNQASLGDQVSGIEEKIPESASGTNHLITKQQLFDEEMDIRSDFNESISDIQTMLTLQAKVLSDLDSGKLDKNQDVLNAGKVLVVGNDGYIELSSEIGGGGLQAVAHDSTLSGAGTDTSPLGLAEAIKDEIADKAPKETVEALAAAVSDIIMSYVKKSGDTMTGGLTLPELTIRTAEGEFSVSVVAGVVTIATNNGLDVASHVKFDHAPTTDDNTTWADALDTSLVRKAQVATAIASSASITIRNWQ